MSIESVLLFIIGILLGSVVIGLVLNVRLRKKGQEIILLNSDLAARTAESAHLSKRLEDELQREERDKAESKERWESERREIIERYEREKKEEGARHDRQLREQLDMMEQRMTNATQELLNKRSKELDETNQLQMGTIISPLKDTMEQMKKALDDSNIRNAENASSLKEQIKNLLESTKNIGQEADKLSRALHSKTKVQGNFGEMVLSELLDKFGFRRGVEYDVQETLRDDSGHALINDNTNGRMITDVILHYPDGKDVIIDSKVSLTAFTDYVNADTEEEKENFLNQHVQSIRNQVKILANKDYSSFVKKPHMSLDFVIMFVPIESALVLAMSKDTTLWREAFEKKVFITGEQNLFAVLKMIQLAWNQKNQRDNQRKVYELAETFLKRVGEFTKRFDEIGSNIEKTRSAFDEAKKKLMDGRMNVIAPAKKMVELGAKEDAKYRLPSTEDEELAEGE